VQQPALLVKAMPQAISPRIATPVNGRSCIFGEPIAFHVVDDGGGASTGGGYMLNGTIGQPDAGMMMGARIPLWVDSGAEAYRAQRRGTSICPSSCASRNALVCQKRQ